MTYFNTPFNEDAFESEPSTPNMETPNENSVYEPTIDDLVNFTVGYETYSPSVYQLQTSDKTRMQDLAGYGSANPKIIELARQGKLTEPIARQEVKRSMENILNGWKTSVPNFEKLPVGVQLALVDTAYNGKGVEGTIKGSPSLMKMINTGVVDPNELVKQMDHSKKAGGWLGVRSAARRAMALGKYDWRHKDVDKYGRQIDINTPKSPQDWTRSPYYNKYRNGGFLKRVK